MNSRVACVMISMAAACFHAGLWAGVVVRDVAIQDLTPSPSSPVLVVRAQNWSSKDAANNKLVFDTYLRDRPEYIKTNYEYHGDGPNGMPTLMYVPPIEYKTYPGVMPKDMPGARVYIPTKSGIRYVNPNYLALASQACLYLDYELSGTLGSWGPECKITKFLKMPTNGALVKLPGTDQYTYAPKRPQTKDSVRFILENGAGKQVDVTVDLSTGADDTDYSLDLNNNNESIDLATFTSW